MRSNRQVVLKALAQNGLSLQHAPPQLQEDREVVSRAELARLPTAESRCANTLDEHLWHTA